MIAGLLALVLVSADTTLRIAPPVDESLTAVVAAASDTLSVPMAAVNVPTAALPPHIEAVDVRAVAVAARDHLHVADAAIVLVGDADAFLEALEATGLGPIVIERHEVMPAAGPIDAAILPGPVDDEDETGPTAGTEEPDLPGNPAGPAAADLLPIDAVTD